MLVSHRKHFIFTKTIKTAGTSVESYFEQFCMPDGEWQESHSRDEYISKEGIIGYRGPNPSDSTWFNHMPAKEIHELVGKAIWDKYFKFTVIRNPYDKLISAFYFYGSEAYLKIAKNQTSSRNNPIFKVKGKTEIERFRSWIKEGGAIIDRNIYLIDGQECVDYFIRFEDLHSGIKYVCNCLSIPFEPTRIPELKKGVTRHHKIKIQDYYDNETIRIVQDMYAWELKRFGYDLPL